MKYLLAYFIRDNVCQPEVCGPPSAGGREEAADYSQLLLDSAGLAAPFCFRSSLSSLSCALRPASSAMISCACNASRVNGAQAQSIGDKTNNRSLLLLRHSTWRTDKQLEASKGTSLGSESSPSSLASVRAHRALFSMVADALLGLTLST